MEKPTEPALTGFTLALFRHMHQGSKRDPRPAAYRANQNAARTRISNSASAVPTEGCLRQHKLQQQQQQQQQKQQQQQGCADGGPSRTTGQPGQNHSKARAGSVLLQQAQRQQQNPASLPSVTDRTGARQPASVTTPQADLTPVASPPVHQPCKKQLNGTAGKPSRSIKFMQARESCADLELLQLFEAWAAEPEEAPSQQLQQHAANAGALQALLSCPSEFSTLAPDTVPAAGAAAAAAAAAHEEPAPRHHEAGTVRPADAQADVCHCKGSTHQNQHESQQEHKMHGIDSMKGRLHCKQGAPQAASPAQLDQHKIHSLTQSSLQRLGVTRTAAKHYSTPVLSAQQATEQEDPGDQDEASAGDLCSWLLADSDTEDLDLRGTTPYATSAQAAAAADAATSCRRLQTQQQAADGCSPWHLQPMSSLSSRTHHLLQMLPVAVQMLVASRVGSIWSPPLTHQVPAAASTHQEAFLQFFVLGLMPPAPMQL